MTNKWTRLSLLDVQKNDVWVSSKINSVNLVKALLGLMFNVCSFEAKNRLFEFDHKIDEHVSVRLMFEKNIFVEHVYFLKYHMIVKNFSHGIVSQ